MQLKKLTYTFIIFLFTIVINGQEKPTHEIKYHVDKEGNLHWNKDLPFFIRISPTAEGEGLLMESKISKEYTNPAYFDTEGLNKVRTRYAVNKDTKKTIIPKTEVIWEVYVDGIAPKSFVTFEKAPRYFTRSTKYYGKNLSLDIQTKDPNSGIKQLFYSLNGESYKEYSNIIPINSEGNYNLKFYAVDNVGNAEESKEYDFIADLSSPKTYYNITGIAKDKVISIATQIYLDPTDSISGVAKTYYRFDDGKEMLYTNGSSLPIKQLSDGDHKLYFYSIDKVDNKEEEFIVEFYLDRTAPIMAADILGDRYLLGNKVFFSGRTKMKLTAVDNKAGVKNIMYSIDGSIFNIYNQPFYLPSITGVHLVKYYATDNMANETDKDGSKFEKYKHVVSRVYVDLSGPILKHQFIGMTYKARDTLFINKQTKLKFSATDAESGLQYITYGTDNQYNEEKYSEPISFDKEGFHQIEYYGYDNVNNRNRNELFAYMDETGPDIKYNFSISAIGQKEGLPVYPHYVNLFLGAQDQIIGAKDIYYTTNNLSEKRYSLSIKGFKRNSINTVKIRARDHLNNETIETLQFYIE